MSKGRSKEKEGYKGRKTRVGMAPGKQTCTRERTLKQDPAKMFWKDKIDKDEKKRRYIPETPLIGGKEKSDWERSKTHEKKKSRKTWGGTCSWGVLTTGGKKTMEKKISKRERGRVNKNWWTEKTGFSF